MLHERTGRCWSLPQGVQRGILDFKAEHQIRVLNSVYASNPLPCSLLQLVVPSFLQVKGLKSKTIWSNDGDGQLLCCSLSSIFRHSSTLFDNLTGWKEGSTFIPATSFQGARRVQMDQNCMRTPTVHFSPVYADAGEERFCLQDWRPGAIGQAFVPSLSL